MAKRAAQQARRDNKAAQAKQDASLGEVDPTEPSEPSAEAE
jgi:hypothetical protein